jgi:hypothetical protein
LLRPPWRATTGENHEAFGTAGQASRIKLIPLTRMAERYDSGEPKQTVV